jgi:Tfp pilus assembly protein PilF
VLLNFGRFLTRAKGDVELAALVYRKAMQVQPESGAVVASYAHFLACEGRATGSSSLQDAQQLFQK